MHEVSEWDVMQNRWLKTTVTWCASIATVVACGPQGGNSTQVRILQKSPLAKSLSVCAESIQPKFAKAVKNLKIKTPICVAEYDDSGSAKGGFERIERDLSYRIGKHEDRLQIALTAGIYFPKDIPVEVENRVHKVIREVCMPKLQEVWGRSEFDVDLDLRFTTAEPGAEELDQYLDFAAVGSMEKESAPEFFMLDWPDSPRLKPFLASADEGVCSAKRGPERLACEEALLWRANAPFCRSLVSMVAHWFNLPSVRSASEKCEVPAEMQSAEMPKAAPEAEGDKPLPKLDLSIQDWLAKPVGPDRGFGDEDHLWAAMKFSKRDLVEMLKPACPKLTLGKSR